MPQTREHVDRPTILAAAAIVAVGGLIYELLLGTASSYLFGDSIKSFSLAIGTTLFGMGLGSLAATRLRRDPGLEFVRNELALSFIGGNSVLILLASYSFTKVYWAVFVALSILVGFLIGLEIPLMMRMARQHSSEENVDLLGKILALDYCGALAASILFPFLLLPYFGLVQTAYLVALLNALIAWYILRRLRIAGGLPRAERFGVWAAVTILALGFAFSHRIEGSLSAASLKDPVVFYDFTPYQRIALTRFKGDTRLYLNNQLQFSSLDEARYHETLAHAAMSTAPAIESVLILGGGDGLLARELARYPEVKKITVVDIDPAVTEMARSHRLMKDLNGGVFDDRRVRVINRDAFRFLADSDERYDVILADLVDPANERIAKLYSKEFYRHAAGSLEADGVFITQATSTYFTPGAFQVIEETIGSAFPPGSRVVPLSVNVPSFGEWGFVMAGPGQLQPFAGRELPVGLRHLDEGRLTRLLFSAPGRDNQPAEKIPASTLLRPSVYLAYSRDMDRWRY